MTREKIAIGCDHAGFGLKEKIKAFLMEKGYDVRDFGTHSAESVDYPDFIHPVASSVETGEVDWGIILCGSGNGAAMTANKHQRIRAALCWIPEIAVLAREHNNANIISIPARFVDDELAVKIIEAFINATFEGGRHERRIKKIPIINNEENE